MAADPARDVLAAENRRALASVMRRAEAPEPEALDPEPQAVDSAPSPSQESPPATAAPAPLDIASGRSEAAPDGREAAPEAAPVIEAIAALVAEHPSHATSGSASPAVEKVAAFEFDFDLIDPPDAWPDTAGPQPDFGSIPGLEAAPPAPPVCERRHLSTRLIFSVGLALPVATALFGLLAAITISSSRGGDATALAAPEPAIAAAPAAVAVAPPAPAAAPDAPLAGAPIAEPPAIDLESSETATPPETAIPPEAPPASAPPEVSIPAAPVHVVAAGDTLYGLSARYETTPERIVELNGLSDSDALSIGQRLLIPPPEPGAPGAIEHIVSAGETLSGLSAHYGTTIEVVTALNRLGAGASIYIGQRLILPVRAGAAEDAGPPALDDPAAAPAVLPGRPIVTGGLDLWSCGDFESWAQAQAVYEANLPGDPNLIDGDGNGIACEALRRSEEA